MDSRRFERLTRPGVVQRILVRGTNWIGDAVLTTPALMALRAGFPKAKIAVLAKPAVADLLQNHPAVDEIVVYRDPGPDAGLGGKLTLAHRLREGRYDLAVLLQNAFEAAAVTALAGIPNRYGYATDGRWFLLTHRVPLSRSTRRKHHVEYYLELLRPLGIPVTLSPPGLRTTPEEDAAARERLRSLEVPEGRLLIGLNPGSTYGTAKRWIPERFSEVAGRLAAEYGGHVLIFGGRGEESLGTAIAGRMTSPSAVLSGRTTVRELMALIKACGLFITNDSGPMHIAAAFGVPLVAIFGPTDPVTTSPFGDGYELIRKSVDCSPCLLRECPIDHRCMQGIGVDAVHAAAVRQLQAASPPPSPSPLKGEGIFNSPSPLEGEGRVRGNAEAAPVVFLDRDGTLNKDPGYLNHPDAVELLPGVGPAVARLNEARYRTVVVTNQSGIGRGLIEPYALEAVHLRLRQLLAKDGASLDGIYFCTHRPEEGCECRKPAPGLVNRARRDLGLGSGKSFVVGDKASDVELARNIGATAVFVLSGNHPAEQLAKMADKNLVPDYMAKDLAEAVEWILEKERAGVHA
jgi:heptosyltransferase-2